MIEDEFSGLGKQPTNNGKLRHTEPEIKPTLGNIWKLYLIGVRENLKMLFPKASEIPHDTNFLTYGFDEKKVYAPSLRVPILQDAVPKEDRRSIVILKDRRKPLVIAGRRINVLVPIVLLVLVLAVVGTVAIVLNP